MRVRALFLGACISIAMAACSIGKPRPTPTTYLIGLPDDRAPSETHRLPDLLRVGSVRVAAPFAGRGMVYRFDDVRYVSDPYQVFGSDPGAMLASRIAERLDDSGPFHAVLQPGSSSPTRYVLEIGVTDLYGDFRNTAAPAAVMALQFMLIDTAGVSPGLIYERSIARSVPLPRATPENLVRGYGEALAGSLSQLVVELRTLEYPH